MTEHLLDAQDLERAYSGPHGSATVAVDGVSIRFRRGSSYGLVGESGSGKSTLSRLLLALERPPELIVHTNPIEHSTVANDCALDVFGWAEPGTKIVVNGRGAPVSPDGLFMENVPLSRDNTIVVEAQHKKGEKRIVRSFEVMYEPDK